ncbi:MAG: hypothetical protein DRI65_16640 [Chloroflexota bacterium]|nr:MAG: hypothetical protein DRI65_16640 [Chloroflexota bacterium]
MSNEINSNIKNIAVVQGSLTDEEIYLLGNDDPWAGMSLDFQAINTIGNVEIGIGGITTVRSSDAYVYNKSTQVYDLFTSDQQLWLNGELQYYPDATNSIYNSADLSNTDDWSTSGICTATLDVTGLDGSANSATTVRNIGLVGVDEVSGGDGHTYANDVIVGLKVWAKKVTTSGLLTIQQNAHISFGEWTVDVSLIGSGFEQLTEEHPAVTVVTPMVASNAGVFGIKFYTDVGLIDIVIGNVQAHEGKTIAEIRGLPFIPTTFPTTMLRTDYSFDIANYVADDGIIVCEESRSLYSSEAGAGQVGLISIQPSAEPVYKQTPERTSTYGGDIVGMVNTFSANQVLESGVVYIAGGDLGVFVDNVIGDEAAGQSFRAPALSALELFYNETYACTMKNLRRYHITSYIQGASFVSRNFPAVQALDADPIRLVISNVDVAPPNAGFVGTATISPNSFKGSTITQSVSFGANWWKSSMDEIPNVSTIYIRFNGFTDIWYPQDWDGASYAGSIPQGAAPTNIQDWINAQVGQDVQIEFSRSPTGMPTVYNVTYGGNQVVDGYNIIIHTEL